MSINYYEETVTDTNDDATPFFANLKFEYCPNFNKIKNKTVYLFHALIGSSCSH